MRVSRSRRRVLTVGGVLFGMVILYTLLYDWGMTALEGRPRSLLSSLGVVIETMTTTGFGGDAPWSHPFMIILSILMQASGIIGIFALVNVLAADRIRRVLDAPPRTSVSSSLSNHVVICGAEDYVSFLIEELSSVEREHVVISNDETTVRELQREGYNAIYNNPEAEEGLRDARAHAASHIIVDIGNTRNTSAILAAEREAPNADIIALANERRLRPYYEYAGAEAVLSPRELTGQALADKASTGVKYDIDDGTSLGNDLEIREVTMQAASPLIGKKIRETSLKDDTGITIVGVWIDGILQLPPEPDAKLSQDSVLVVAGREEEIEELRKYVRPPQIPVTHDDVIIGGYGETGHAAERYLEQNGVDVTTIDTNPDVDPDIVGKADERDVLEEAGIQNTGAFVIAVSDDPSALLAALIARRTRGENLEIALAAKDTDAIQKAFQAGANHAVARPRVAGRLIAREIEGKTSLDPTSHIRIAQFKAEGLAGETLRSAQVRAETGVTVVALLRDGSFISPVGPTKTLKEDDSLVVVGTDENVRNFAETFSEGD